MRTTYRSARALLAAALTCAAVAATPTAAAGQTPATPATPATITAVGVGDVEVDPRDRRSETSIRRAVEEAREAALPRAVRAGRARAAELARVAGLGLGPLQGISEAQSNGPYGFYYGPFGPQSPTFANNRWCGRLTRGIYRREGDRRRRVGTRTSRVCRFPRRVVASVTLTFAVQPS